MWPSFCRQQIWIEFHYFLSFLSRFHWSQILMFQFAISHHRFSWGLVTQSRQTLAQPTSQLCQVLGRHGFTCLQWVKILLYGTSDKIRYKNCKVNGWSMYDFERMREPWGAFCISTTTGYGMMTSSNGNIFRVTGLLCGKLPGHRWIPLTKASDAELWCFL